jgi:pyruvyltransferase
MLHRIQAIPRKLNTMARLWGGEEAVILRWATEGVIARNWGDKLNPWMAERVTGQKILHRAEIYPFPARPIHYWIGSHLATACGDPNGVVWGAGFISRDVPVIGQPKEIHAVRGWLSVKRLQVEGFDAPRVVGDPALLLPRFYSPKTVGRRYSLGIIPHCFEWNEPFFVQARQWEDALVIDITGGIEEVVDQINACDRIVSSSLHGIICADAYGVPSLWLHASDKPTGDGFKFLDYFSSVGREERAPMVVDASTTRQALEDRFVDYSIDIDLDALWAACPLRRD